METAKCTCHCAPMSRYGLEGFQRGDKCEYFAAHDGRVMHVKAPDHGDTGVIPEWQRMTSYVFKQYFTTEPPIPRS